MKKTAELSLGFRFLKIKNMAHFNAFGELFFVKHKPIK